MADYPDFDFDLIANVLGVDRRTLPDKAGVQAESQPVQRIVFEPLTDAEWEIVRTAMPSLPVPRPGGFRDREFFDAVLWFRCAVDRGYGWAALPPHFPPRMTMQHRWHRWAVAGTWEQIAEQLKGCEGLSQKRRDAFCRIAADAAKRRERILTRRQLLNESLQ